MWRLLVLPQYDNYFKHRIRQNERKCLAAWVNSLRSDFFLHSGGISFQVHWFCEFHFQCSTYARFDAENYSLLCTWTAVSVFPTTSKCSQSIPIHLNQIHLCFNSSLLPLLQILPLFLYSLPVRLQANQHRQTQRVCRRTVIICLSLHDPYFSLILMRERKFVELLTCSELHFPQWQLKFSPKIGSALAGWITWDLTPCNSLLMLFQENAPS